MNVPALDGPAKFYRDSVRVEGVYRMDEAVIDHVGTVETGRTVFVRS